MNDVCFDFCVGKVGIVYVMDLLLFGVGGLIVMDFDSGKVVCCFIGDVLMFVDLVFVLVVEG